MRETRFTCATQSQSCNREWWYASERKRGCRQHSGMWISFAPFHATKWVRSVVEIGPPFEKCLPSTMENRDIDCTSVILEWIHGHACYNNDLFHGDLVTTYYLDFWQVGRARKPRLTSKQGLSLFHRGAAAPNSSGSGSGRCLLRDLCSRSRDW